MKDDYSFQELHFSNLNSFQITGFPFNPIMFDDENQKFGANVVLLFDFNNFPFLLKKRPNIEPNFDFFK